MQSASVKKFIGCQIGRLSRISRQHPIMYSQLTSPKKMETRMTLYGDIASPPVRFVMITATALRLRLEMHHIDLFAGENKQAFYTKVNPLQKVPALAINEDTVISDSHAIAMFLCENFKGQHLYPNSGILRAQIQRMLFFNCGTLFPIDSSVFGDYFAGKWTNNDERVETWNKALDFLDLQLSKHAWLAGNEVTLCDICCGSTVSSLQLLLPSTPRHENVNRWMKKLIEIPYFEINTRGLERLRQFILLFTNNV